MTGEGRNIFNLASQPDAIEGTDYEFYCPITLDNEGKVNKNQPDYFEDMKKCQLDDSEVTLPCRTDRTLEQTFSKEQEGMKSYKYFWWVVRNYRFQHQSNCRPVTQ